MNTQQRKIYSDGRSSSVAIPHKGSLCKIHLMTSHPSPHKGSTSNSSTNSNFIYAITIVTCNTSSSNTSNTETISSLIQKDNSEFPLSTSSTSLLDMTHFNNEPFTSSRYQRQEQPQSQPQSQSQPQPQNFELRFKQGHYNVMTDLFSILDTDSRGIINKTQVREFIHLRCPVFRRRDRALDQYLLRQNRDVEVTNTASLNGGTGEGGDTNIRSLLSNTTFEEVWNAMVGCSSSVVTNKEGNNEKSLIGIEGWMVFSRFIALAQYQEAKRRFSSRHQQQTIQKHRGEGGGEGDFDEGDVEGDFDEGDGEGDFDEGGNHGVVLVNVPPPESPAPITVKELVDYETVLDTNVEGVALPELDLDHSHVSVHDTNTTHMGRGGGNGGGRGVVKIEVFGTSNSATLNHLEGESRKLDFVVRFFPPLDEHTSSVPSSTTTRPTGVPEINDDDLNNIVVKRSFADFVWLHNIFTSQKQLGGTLCGRILPPFPPIRSTYSDYHKNTSSSSLPQRSCCGGGGNTTTPAIAVASASVGMISSAARSAKSFLGGYLSSTTSITFPHGLPPGTNILTTTVASKRDGSLLDSSLSKANQIERYLNFLLEHPALHTSFPLNVILKASQSGLECAKRILDKNVKHLDRNPDFRLVASEAGLNTNHNCLPSNSTDLATVHPPSCWERKSNRHLSSSHGQNNKNLSWIRTAAQAALALKLHGVLETTGCQSASVKLLHASLPNIYSSSLSSWNDVDNDDVVDMHPSLNNKNNIDDDDLEQFSKKVDTVSALECDGDGDCKKDMDESDLMVCEFEKGVVSIKSELKAEVIGEEGETLDCCGDEYDMLPAPMSLSKRSALCAGSNSSFPKKQYSDGPTTRNEGFTNNWDHHHQHHQKQQRRGYHYGSISDDLVVLGDISVDKDINKLRDIIRSLNDTLGRCLAATQQIGAGVRHRTKLHMNILGGLDSCEGIRGEIITQRALLLGVTSLEKGYNISDISAMELSRGLSWNKALASSAVHAAEEVRDAVKVSRRASQAKLAADAAAQKVQNEWSTAKSLTDDETRAAQARVSSSRSQAIHAAVVEHEALTAKRRATMALAHDTKCWNVHRKREILRTCLKTGKAQRDAARQCVAAWVQLRDGVLDMSSFPTMTVQTRVDTTISKGNPPSNLVLSERLQEEDEKNSLAMMGCTSLDSSSEEKHVYDSEHDLFVDYFAAVSKGECCEEESVTPKVIASNDLDNGNELQNILSNSDAHIMGVVEKITSNLLDDKFDESAQACYYPENETLSNSRSSLTMPPYTQQLSAMSDACAGPDNEQLIFAQEKSMHTDASKIEEQLNQILAPIGKQSLRQAMDDSTNPPPPLIVDGGDVEPTITQHANPKPIMESCMEHSLYTQERRKRTKASKTEEQFNRFLAPIGKQSLLQAMDDSTNNPKPVMESCMEQNLDTQESSKHTKASNIEEQYNRVLTPIGKQSLLKAMDDSTNPPSPHIVDAGDEMSTIAQYTNERPIMQSVMERNIESNASENICNGMLANPTNTSLLDQNEATNSEQFVTNYYTEASNTISDYLGGGSSNMGPQQVINTSIHEGSLRLKDNTTKEQDDILSSSHRPKIGLTDSMQSLVDGLMLWGEQWDSEDDLSLPRGMAASLAMDESGILH